MSGVVLLVGERFEYLHLDFGKERVEHSWTGTRQKIINVSREESVVDVPVKVKQQEGVSRS